MAFRNKNHLPTSVEVPGINEHPGFFKYIGKLGIGAFAAANMVLPSSSPAVAAEVTSYVASHDELQPETETFVSMSETLTVANWNTFFGNMPENVRDSVMSLLRQKSIDVIGLEEVHNPETRRLLADSINCLLCDYAGYVETSDFEGSSKASLPFIWRKDVFDLESHGVRKVSDRVTGIDDDTGDNMSVSEKNLVYYVLVNKETGVRTRFLITQTVADFERDGEDISQNGDRVKLYKGHIKMMKEFVKELNAKDNIPTVIIADLNVDANYDDGSVSYYPEATAKEMGFVFADGKLSRSDQKLGTHQDPESGKKRRIDHILVSDDGKYVPGAAYVHKDKMGSDHRPLITKLRVV
ncbi:MAG: endonuclease/exonuclease/phosphatase family protein, partial [Candidatus Saccharimonadaceae bacterium]